MAIHDLKLTSQQIEYMRRMAEASRKNRAFRLDTEFWLGFAHDTSWKEVVDALKPLRIARIVKAHQQDIRFAIAL